MTQVWTGTSMATRPSSRKSRNPWPRYPVAVLATVSLLLGGVLLGALGLASTCCTWMR